LDKVKELGQVFTPIEVVRQILDEVGFTAESYDSSMKILEPSYGEGIFIYEIIERIVESSRAKRLSKLDLEFAIDNSVWAIEYDEELHTKVKKEIINFVKDKFELNISLPNLLCMDSLDFKEYEAFDFVVGNPPYVRIHHMDPLLRQKVKEYEHSTGTTDLYIIFYELGLRWLNKSGKLGYIAPNAWLKNASQSKFRKDIIESKVLKKIIDFGSKVIFPKIGTYTCITILDKSANHKDFVFSYEGDQKHFSVALDLVKLLPRAERPLNFTSNENYTFLEKLSKGKKIRLGDVSSIQNGLATLGDKMFLFDESKIAKYGVELSVLRPIVKASRYKGGEITDKIFFPYYEDKEGRMVGYTELELKAKAPKMYAYLLGIKKELEARSLDSNSLWFWYGRSQAIQATNKEKLVFQPLIGPKQKTIKTYIIPAGILVYSGLFIVENGKDNLIKISKELESSDFCKYITLVGQDKSGGYKSMNSKNVKEYPIR
jgi:adenine-specific DNA-methyltransferase